MKRSKSVKQLEAAAVDSIYTSEVRTWRCKLAGNLHFVGRVLMC